MGVLCKGLPLKVAGSTVQGPEARIFRAIEIEEVPLGKLQARPWVELCGSSAAQP